MALYISFDLASLSRDEATNLMVVLAGITGPVNVTPIGGGTRVAGEAVPEPAPLGEDFSIAEEEAFEKIIFAAPEVVEEKATAPVAENSTVPERETESKVTRRGRPKKVVVQEEEAMVEVAKPLVVCPVTVPAVPMPVPVPTSPAPVRSYTMDEIRTALKSFTEKHDVQAGIALLADFKCVRASDMAAMPAGTQALFIGRCNG